MQKTHSPQPAIKSGSAQRPHATHRQTPAQHHTVADGLLTQGLNTHDNPYSAHPSHLNLLALQRTLGNRTVGQLIQSKLTISHPNDPDEREADQVADTVMRMTESRAPADKDTPMQPKPLVPRITPLVQRAAEDVVAMKPRIQRMSASALAEEPVSARPLMQRQAEEEQVSPAVAANVHALQGGGSPLPRVTRAFFESRFGVDCSQMRVHTDSRAAETANAIHAKAFTVGRNIAFGTGDQLRPMTGLPVQRKCEHCEEEEKLQLKEIDSKNGTLVQLKPLAPGIAMQKKCANCEEEEQLQMQNETGTTGNITVPLIVHDVIKSQGNVLDATTRDFMESRFGYDFSQVQVHNDPSAARSAKAINALAYTHGNHVVFASGQYQPKTKEGKKLLAHELTHVVQQGKAGGKTIRRQPDLHSLSGNINANTMRHVPVEKWDERIEREYLKRGDYERATAVRNCRVQGGDACVKILTIGEVHKMFEVTQSHKGNENEIYRKLINFLPAGLAAQALAHVVASFVTELVEFARFQTALKNQGYVILEDALGICIGGCHMDDVKTPRLLDCTPSQAELNEGANEEYELKGNGSFQPTGSLETYIQYTLSYASSVPVKVRFGNQAHGTIQISGFGKDKVSPLSAFSFQGPKTAYDCFSMDKKVWVYNASEQLITFTDQAIDTSDKNGTLALGTHIEFSKITGFLSWLPGRNKNNIDPVMDLIIAETTKEYFIPLLLGKENEGRPFKEDSFSNHLDNGALKFNLQGVLDAKNLQKLNARFSLMNEISSWAGSLDVNVFGAELNKLEIGRTAIGFLAGEKDGLNLDKSWEGKGFKANANLHMSYVNSNLFASGKAKFQAERGEGELFLAVTNYSTAKRYAVGFLPEEVAQFAQKDKAPENADERLAFVGTGKLHFILIKDLFEKKQGKKMPIAADVSCVIEPEGFITVAGQIKQTAGEFILFDKKEYSYTTEIAAVPVITIPGPIPGSHGELTFSVDFNFGAFIGPLTLSEITLSGIYSSRPESLKELELSGLLHLSGGLFAKLAFCIKATAGWGPFDITLVKECWDYGPTLNGSISARPTITIRDHKENSVNTLPKYSFKGNFDFGASGQLSSQVKDSFKFDAKEKEDDKDKSSSVKKTPKTYMYKNNNKPEPQNFRGKDIMVPIDHTLGSEEPPEKISYDGLKKANFNTSLNRAIKDRKPGEKYFEEGKSADTGASSDDTAKPFDSGDFMEGGQLRGKLEKDEVPKAPKKSEATYLFTEDFNMKSALHKLQLLVNVVKKDGKVETIKQILMMSSELETLHEKIEEEKKEIVKTPDPSDTFQQKDLHNIEVREDELKKEIEELAVNNQLNEEMQIPELLEETVALENYANRYNKEDFGVVDKPAAAPSNCKKPADIHPGQEIMFEHYFTDGVKTGEVIEIIEYPDSTGRKHWHIKFRPKFALSKTSMAPRAYFDDDCKKPTYTVPPTDASCQTKFIDRTTTINVPSRSVGGKSYYGYEKAHIITAVPLCWGPYQEPEKPIVGIDRIRPNKIWHRAHLLHGELGGEGIRANLVPTSKYFNNVTMPKEYENRLFDDVVKGRNINKYYWFKAEVIYKDQTDNFDVKHYSDFVKEIKIWYGEAIPKDPDKKTWTLLDPIFSTSFGTDYEPSFNDIKSTRTEG